MAIPKKKKSENNADFANRLISGAKGKTNFTKPPAGTTLKVSAPKQSFARTIQEKKDQRVREQLKQNNKEIAAFQESQQGQQNKLQTRAEGNTIFTTQNNQSLQLPNGAAARNAQLPSSTGFGNVGRTLNAAFNPLSSDSVAGNFKSNTINSIAESIANNPYIAALTGAGIAGIAKNAVKIASIASKSESALQLGKAATTGTVGAVAKNTYTKGIQKVIVVNAAKSTGWKIAGAATAAILIGEKALELTLGGRNFGNFIGMEEASQTIDIARREAYQAGDWESYDELSAQKKEVMQSNDFWDAITPWKNVAIGLNKYRSASLSADAVWDKLAADRRTQIETGETEPEYRERIAQEENNQYQENIDYYNEQRKLMIQYERQAQIEARNADAAFWRAEHERQRELEEADRKAIAEFWEAYKKQIAKTQEESRPSKLNFGLI